MAGGRETVLVHSPLVSAFVTKGTYVSGCLGASSLFVSPLRLPQLLFATDWSRPTLPFLCVYLIIWEHAPRLNGRRRGHVLSDPVSWLTALRNGLWEHSTLKRWVWSRANWFTGRCSPDLDLISSIVWPTELTNIITLESITHYRVGCGASVFTGCESRSESKPAFSID